MTVNSCKGICPQYKSPNGWWGRGLQSRAYCSGCILSTDWKGVYCPCCGIRMRTNVHHSQSRKKNIDLVVRY